MPDFSKLRNELSSIEKMERELHLKQLQINRLLNITQAINNNVKAKGLYEMYTSFLSWEMGVKKMALFVKKGDSWVCPSSINIDEELLKTEIGHLLPKYQRLKNLEDDSNNPLISEFDIVIPVLHKENAIAYTFIGGFDEDEDMYNKVQFITTISNIIAVAIENKRLFKRQIEQERYQREMELAGEMQRMLIPASFPKSSVFELSSIYKPMLGVGGDYFDFIEFDDDKFAFCIADISGKGIAAALLMANFQANFHSLIHKRSSLDTFVRALNKSLFRITKGDKFLTLFIAEFNKKTYELNYINAGHNQPFMAMNGQVSNLDKGCTILGSFEELPDVQIGTVKIDNEAIILTFTDGLTDLLNEEGKHFDEEELTQFTLDHEDYSASLFNEKLMKAMELFRGEQAYPDDIAVLTCKIFAK